MQIDLTKIYKRYRGLWVALNDEWDTVVSSNKDVRKARDEAVKKGYKEPFMFKVPTENAAYIG